ncbi:MAG: hypothetical protein NZ898_00165 [Myxococcota bacterium]|nr:hypothetical protein [Myxococcota bacterium]MDW8361698.1 hypothetical protein [Myxococcales bacterium]
MAVRALCLVGMSGVGKSHWAAQLASSVGFRHLDCDGAIAAVLHARGAFEPGPGEAAVHALGRWMGMPWSPGYELRQALYLRIEHDVTADAIEAVRSAAGGERFVIDTTGSVVMLHPALRTGLRTTCRVVHLTVPRAMRARLLAEYLARPRPIVWGNHWRPQPGEAASDALRRLYPRLVAWRERRYGALAHARLDAQTLRDAAPTAARERLLEALETRVRP